MSNATLPNNLLLSLSSFVGRENEIAEIGRWVGWLDGRFVEPQDPTTTRPTDHVTTRLVTLTGAGGAGKTRLALQVGASLLSSSEDAVAPLGEGKMGEGKMGKGKPRLYTDGVWFIALAPLSDPALVPQAVANVLGLREQTNEPLTTSIIYHLRDKQVLLILDNCEHLIVATAQLADALLRACPHVQLLATSREPLNIEGEVAYRVPPLSLPPDFRNLGDFGSLAQYEAVRLFVERATAADSRFALTLHNAPSVTQICQRLDGMPLALELAAARVRGLSVEQIAAHLDHALSFLTTGKRTAAPRQQTMRAAIDWSYNLLADAECALFRRLSVFAGGWTVEAAEAVCGDAVGAIHESLLHEMDVLDVLTQLVDKSLVIKDEREGETRYRMLEPIRQYAWEKLEEAREVEWVRNRHLDFFVRLAEEVDHKFQGVEQKEWLYKTESELNNVRTALNWSLQSEDVTTGLRLASALNLFYQYHSYQNEGLRWLLTLLARPSAVQKTITRAKALNFAAYFQSIFGNLTQAHELGIEALDLARLLDDQPTLSMVLRTVASVAAAQGNHAEAYMLIEEALTIARSLKDSWTIARTLVNVGVVALFAGQYERAGELCEESICLFKELGEVSVRAFAHRVLGYSLLHQKDYQRATIQCEESLSLNIALGEKGGAASALAALAGISLALGTVIRTVKLCGVVSVLLESTASRQMVGAVDKIEYERTFTTLRAQLDPATFEQAWNEGRVLSLDQAIALAQQITVEAQIPSPNPSTLLRTSPKLQPQTPNSQLQLATGTETAGLTERELEVLRWLVRGLTDGDIAKQLVVSRRTVHAHLRSIYSKLDVTTRNAAVRVAMENKLV